MMPLTHGQVITGSCGAGEDRQHPGVAIEMVPRNLARGEEPGQRHITQRLSLIHIFWR